MTNHLVRLYTAAGAIVVFFLLWATIAAHPWATTDAGDATGSAARGARSSREEAAEARRARQPCRRSSRWAVYERRSARRQWQNAVALQRHLQELEASQAAAVRAAQSAAAQTTQARAYAASVVAWANQQLQAAGVDGHGGCDGCAGSRPQGRSDEPGQRAQHRQRRSCSGSDGTGSNEDPCGRSCTNSTRSSPRGAHPQQQHPQQHRTSSSSTRSSISTRTRPGSCARPGRSTAAGAGRITAAGDHDEAVGEEAVSTVAHDPAARPLTRRTFDAMGCHRRVDPRRYNSPTEAALAAAESEIHRLERMLSRFLPTSELSLLNAAGALDGAAGAGGGNASSLWTRANAPVDASTRRCTTRSSRPGTTARSRRSPPTDCAISPGAACGGRVTVTGSTIEIEPGYRLDLGGIAKGYAADRACALLADAGPCIVNAGGDLAIHCTPEQGVWPVAVEVPGAPVTLGLGSGALATSGRDHRRWRRGGVELHHLVDPATGLPAVTSLLRVTAFAEQRCRRRGGREGTPARRRARSANRSRRARHSRPCSSPPTDGSFLLEGSREL